MKMEPAPGALDYGIVVEKDVDVPMCDGAHLKADVFRPDAAGAFPAILKLDLFLTIRNIDADGNEVLETGQQGTPVPVAKGWLRVSHRELDPQLSRPLSPYHRHRRRLYLPPGEIVRVEVEIWPTSMVFRRGHRIRLDIQPRDGVGSAGYMHYHADYNTGTNAIYAGGEKESYLLLPVIPMA